jgi:hypothetical protein
MGMIVYRLIARKNERQLFPAIPPNWDLAFAKPSQARRVVLEGVHSRRPRYLTPYVLGGSAWRNELNAAGTRYRRVADRTAEAGLDLGYSPSSKAGAAAGRGGNLRRGVLCGGAALLYGVSPFDPPTLALAVGALGAAALVASLVPAWRAVRVDPLIAMRAE